MADITLTVQVSIPVSMAYDGALPGAKQLRKDALAVFLDHPCLRDPAFAKDLEMYVDSIRNEKIEV
jgi:hypothetical protein